MPKTALEKAWADHSRLWEKNRWVYPVISRRAGGLSIGINLNLDKRCSFRCAYCQVDRSVAAAKIPLDLKALEMEIITLLEEYEKNGLTNFANFKDIDLEKRQVRDICLSGDGESTLEPQFESVCSLMAKIQQIYSKYPLQLTLITNGAHLHLENVRRGLRILTEHRGEVWAKLDAGSEEWFRKINGSAISLERIQENLKQTSKDFPMQVQTMLCRIGNVEPSPKEIDLYLNRLEKIYNAGGENLKGVQLYGVVRQTASPEVTALPKEFLENVAEKIKENFSIPVKVY